MHQAEPLVGSTIAQMFQYVNASINGDVRGDMMRKDEKLSKYLANDPHDKPFAGF
jgi:hypothetical protein